MVALPEPRPETPAQAKKRTAIENVQRELLGRQLLFDELTPAGQAARTASGVTALKGVAVGIPAGLAGLPADLFALIARDLPDLYHKLIRGEPLNEEEQGQFYRAADEFQKVAGTEAMAGYMGFEDELQDEDFQQGLMVGAFGADPALIATGIGKILGRGARTTADATRSTDLEPVGVPDAPTTTVPGLNEETARRILRGENVDFDPEILAVQNVPLNEETYRQYISPSGPRFGSNSTWNAEEGRWQYPNEDPADVAMGLVSRTPPEQDNLESYIQMFRDRGEEPPTHLNVDTETGELLSLEIHTERMATPEETAAFIRGEDPAEVAPTDEGIATLPAAEDVIDVEPVAQAALTPIRTEGQQQLRQQAFPITEDADVFEPSGMSELGPGYFGPDRDLSGTVPGSGQRGIATTFDYGNTNLRTIQRQGEVADYSPSFQTLDRLPEKPLGTNQPYTPEEVIDFLEAQPEAAMRDLKGSGFIEYLRSPYAPDTYDSVADLRRDYMIHTPQLRVKTVSNNDIAEQQARLAVDPNSVESEDLLPFSQRNDRDSKLPYSGQQTFFEEGTNQAPFDRGVIIINNPNTSMVAGKQLRAPAGHNYFGSSAGVPGYIAHSRYAVVLGPTGKKIAVIEESQGNTVSQAARGQKISATPLEKARATYLQKNEAYTKHAEVADSILTNRDSLQKARQAIEDKQTGDLDSFANGPYITKDLLNDRPGTVMPNSFYNMFFDAFQKDLKNAEGVFDIESRLDPTLYRAPTVGEELRSVLRRNTSPEQKQLITETLEANQVPHNRLLNSPLTSTIEPEIAKFEDMIGAAEDQNSFYIVRSNLKYMNEQGTLDEKGKQLYELLEFDTPVNNDLSKRILFEGDAFEKYIDKLEDVSSANYREAKQQVVQEFGEEEFNAMSLALDSVNEGRMLPGQPFATTRDFDEYMPRLILQELIRRGDIDEVVFPSPDALMSVSGRSTFRSGPEEAGFRNTYGKGVKKGLNKIKAENPDFKIDTIENYTPGGDPTDQVTLFGSSTVVDLRDPGVRSVFEGRLIRRAKGGEVDLRPQKMIHSGIGAMAKEVM